MKRFKLFFEMQAGQNAIKQAIGQTYTILRSIVNPTARKMMSAVPRAHDVTEKYWKDPNFLQWLKGQGIVTNGLPKFQDGGSGRAYFVGNHVVKFTGNKVEAHVASLVSGREDLPTPVITVNDLKDGMFAILEHKVAMGAQIDKKIRDAADWLTVVVDENPDMVGFPKSEQEQKLLIQKTLQAENGPMDLLPYMMLVMVALSSLYHATGYRHDDAGPSNIGMHKGKIVFPDLGPNEPKGFSPEKALQQIGQNRKSLGLN